MKMRLGTQFYLLVTALSLCLAPASFAQQFRALVYTKTAGWHHDSINNGVTALQKLAQLHHFDLVWSEDSNRYFNDKALSQFDAVIFLLTTGDVLNEEQQAAFERFIQSGKGFVGIHSASDTEYDWEWYTHMVGYMFHIHPQIQTAVLQVEQAEYPGMDRFAKRFLFTDEWYEFGPPKSDQLTCLLSLDESSYDPVVDWGERKGQGMGAFHPISWYQPYDGGRAFYTALGHLPATYDDSHFLHHLFGGIYWAATGKGLSTPD